MDVDQLQRLEVIERIAFERGRQEGLSEAPGHWLDYSVLDDLIVIVVSDFNTDAAPVRAAFNRGHNYGSWQREQEEES